MPGPRDHRRSQLLLRDAPLPIHILLVQERGAVARRPADQNFTGGARVLVGYFAELSRGCQERRDEVRSTSSAARHEEGPDAALLLQATRRVML